VAFNVGRFYPQAPRRVEITTVDAGSRDRILRVAVGDYLERSQRLLSDLANADPGKPLDISEEQERISDLLMESRLYRQTAAVTGERAIGAVLEDLERVLVDLSHERPELSPKDVGYLHERLEGGGILFKVRVLGDNVRSGDGISKGRTL